MHQPSEGDGPDALQKRITALRENSGEPRTAAGNASLGQAIALFMSMGFSFAGALVGALLLGDYLVKRTGKQYWYIVALIVGLVSGVSVVWRLLQPLLKSTR